VTHGHPVINAHTESVSDCCWQGRLQERVDATYIQIWLRGRELHPEGGRIPQIYGSYIKSETADGSIFETNMRQNAPNPTYFHFFPRVTPGPPPLGALPTDPGEGWVGNGRAGKGEGEESGRRGEGRGGEVCVIAVGGIDAPSCWH